MKAKSRLAGPSVRNRLRADYRSTWGREWPHDDALLTAHWREAKQAARVAEQSKSVPPEVYTDTLDRMRADDPTAGWGPATKPSAETARHKH